MRRCRRWKREGTGVPPVRFYGALERAWGVLVPGGRSRAGGGEGRGRWVRIGAREEVEEAQGTEGGEAWWSRQLEYAGCTPGRGGREGGKRERDEGGWPALCNYRGSLPPDFRRSFRPLLAHCSMSVAIRPLRRGRRGLTVHAGAHHGPTRRGHPPKSFARECSASRPETSLTTFCALWLRTVEKHGFQITLL